MGIFSKNNETILKSVLMTGVSKTVVCTMGPRIFF